MSELTDLNTKNVDGVFGGFGIQAINSDTSPNQTIMGSTNITVNTATSVTTISATGITTGMTAPQLFTSPVVLTSGTLALAYKPNTPLVLSGSVAGTLDNSITNTSSNASAECGYTAVNDAGSTTKIITQSTNAGNRGQVRSAGVAGLDLYMEGSSKNIKLSTNATQRMMVSDNGVTLVSSQEIGTANGTGMDSSKSLIANKFIGSVVSINATGNGTTYYSYGTLPANIYMYDTNPTPTATPYTIVLPDLAFAGSGSFPASTLVPNGTECSVYNESTQVITITNTNGGSPVTLTILTPQSTCILKMGNNQSGVSTYYWTFYIVENLNGSSNEVFYWVNTSLTFNTSQATDKVNPIGVQCNYVMTANSPKYTQMINDVAAITENFQMVTFLPHVTTINIGDVYTIITNGSEIAYDLTVLSLYAYPVYSGGVNQYTGSAFADTNYIASGGSYRCTCISNIENGTRDPWLIEEINVVATPLQGLITVLTDIFNVIASLPFGEGIGTAASITEKGAIADFDIKIPNTVSRSVSISSITTLPDQALVFAGSTFGYAFELADLATIQAQAVLNAAGRFSSKIQNFTDFWVAIRDQYQNYLYLLGPASNIAVLLNTPDISNPTLVNTTNTSASLTRLVLTDPLVEQQQITGSTAGFTLQLPSCATLDVGTTYYVMNQSTKSINVCAYWSGGAGNIISTLPTGKYATFTSLNNTFNDPALASAWTPLAIQYTFGSIGNYSGFTTGAATPVQSITLGGTGQNVVRGTLLGVPQSIIANGSYGAVDSNGNHLIQNINFSPPAAASGNIVLTNLSSHQQVFNGTNLNVTLPVTSTLNVGWAFTITNKNSTNTTILSSGGGTVAVLSANNQCIVTCIDTTVSTIAGWTYRQVDVNGNSIANHFLGSLSTYINSATTYYATLAAGTLQLPTNVPVYADNSTGSYTITLPNSNTDMQIGRSVTFSSTVNQLVNVVVQDPFTTKTLCNLYPNSNVTFTCTQNSGTALNNWLIVANPYINPSNNSLTNVSAIENISTGVTCTITVNSTHSLTLDQTYPNTLMFLFTGAYNLTLVLPNVASGGGGQCVLPVGHTYYLCFANPTQYVSHVGVVTYNTANAVVTIGTGNAYCAFVTLGSNCWTGVYGSNIFANF